MEKNDTNDIVPTEEDIEAFKKLLNETYLDPNMVIVWGHDWTKILQDAYNKEKEKNEKDNVPKNKDL